MSEDNRKKISRLKFSPDEDDKLRHLVCTYGEKNWHAIAAEMQNRCPRQCKERWTKRLCPRIIQTPWTLQDDQLLEEKVGELGPRWKEIAKCFPGRTDVSLKNRYSILKRRWNKCINRMLKLSLKQRKRAPTAGPGSDDVLQNLDWFDENETFELNSDLNETLYL
jgi:hypothetical protein